MAPPLLKQSWMGSAVLITSVSQGLVISYPSCLLPALRADDSTIKVDVATESWIVSSMVISWIVGIIGASFLLDIYGRRLSHAIMILPGIMGWLLISFASNVSMLIIGRFLGGITNITTWTIGTIMIGECTEPKYRGIFLNLKTTAFVIGNILMHFIGSYFSWRTTALLSIIPLVLSFGINCSWKESPSWLIKKNRFKESEKNFNWLRGKNEKSAKEFEAMVRAQKEIVSKTLKKLPLQRKIVKCMKLISKKHFVKPLLIIFFGFVLTEGSGRHIFPAYAYDIMNQIYPDNSQSFMFIMIIDIITLVSLGFSCVLVKILRRRTLLFISGVSACVLLLSISLYLFLASTGRILTVKPWVVSSLLIGFFICSNLGCTAIPLVLFGELFSLLHRESATAIGGAMMFVTMFTALKITPTVMFSLKIYGLFALLALTMIISLVYLYFELPETRNRTLQEIEQFFKNGKFLDEDNNIEEEMLTLEASG